jgi:hypothetical protein
MLDVAGRWRHAQALSRRAVACRGRLSLRVILLAATRYGKKRNWHGEMEITVSHSLTCRMEITLRCCCQSCVHTVGYADLIEVGGILRAALQAIVDAGASLNCTCTQGRVHQYQVGAGAATGH